MTTTWSLPDPRAASTLACWPIHDTRPPAQRWCRAGPAYAGAPVLPLDDEPPPGRLSIPGPDAKLDAFVQRLLAAMIDVIEGRRPPAQLIRWVSDEILADLVLRARLHQRNPIALGVRSYRVQLVTPHAAEVSARLRHGHRFTAAAFRVQSIGARWACTVADFGPLGRAMDSPFSEGTGAGGRSRGRSGGDGA